MLTEICREAISLSCFCSTYLAIVIEIMTPQSHHYASLNTPNPSGSVANEYIYIYIFENGCNTGFSTFLSEQ